MLALTEPRKVPVNRSVLREKQRETLNQARGSTVVVISANDEEDEKLILDKVYFDAIMKKLRSAVETLEIAMDSQLFSQILKTAKTLDEDIRLGKLHSIDEAFRED